MSGKVPDFVVRAVGRLPEPPATCGILYERSVEAGDNGGCDDLVLFPCAQCGLPVCGWHAWVVNGQWVCAICYGVEGYERRTVAPVEGEA